MSNKHQVRTLQRSLKKLTFMRQSVRQISQEFRITSIEEPPANFGSRKPSQDSKSALSSPLSSSTYKTSALPTQKSGKQSRMSLAKQSANVSSSRKHISKFQTPHEMSKVISETDSNLNSLSKSFMKAMRRNIAVKRDSMSSVADKDYIRTEMLRNDLEQKRLLHEIRKDVQEQIGEVKKDLGPSVSEYMKIVEAWWTKMAHQYNPKIHPSYVNDLPLKILQAFLIKKGIVNDTHNSNLLFASDLREFGAALKKGYKVTTLSKDEFLRIFSKRVFVKTLLGLINQIEQGSGDPVKDQ